VPAALALALVVALAVDERELEVGVVLELELVHPAVTSRPAATTMAPGLEALQML
jgi:hypothetical protein